MLHAFIQTKNGENLDWEFPGNIYALHSELQTIGIREWPSAIKLTDEEDDPIRVKLYANSEIGNHLIRLFSESHSLKDVEDIVSAVTNANDIIKEELEQQIIHDQYSSPDDLIEDIRQMTYDAGTVSETFYFPLSGQVYEGEYDDYYELSGSGLLAYESKIRDNFEEYMKRDTENMASYYHDIGHKKLLLADWGFECIGNELYGKVDIRLTEPLTPEETEKMKEFVHSQNSDGLGEGYEQHEIETEDGAMYVSFWHSGDDYFVYDQAEMDEYIEQQTGQQMGGM